MTTGRTSESPRIVYQHLAGDLCGFYDRATNTIVVDPRLSPRQQRLTEAHERIHAERGDSCPHTEWLEIKLEIAVDKELAMRLMPWPDLLDAFRWCSTHQEVAHELDVDDDLLALRLQQLDEEQMDELLRTHSEVPA